MENSIIKEKVVPAIAYEPTKSPSFEIIQTAELVGSDVSSFTATQQDRENQGLKQPDLSSSAQISTPPILHIIWLREEDNEYLNRNLNPEDLQSQGLGFLIQ